MIFDYTSTNEFLALSQRFKLFCLAPDEVQNAIKSACDFFRIPMPRMIQDLTNVHNGQTMFVNWDRNRYEDDVLCFNMQQLIDLKVDSKEAFSLVMTHEAAHRALQNTRFPGINNEFGSRNWPQTSLWDAEQDCGIWMNPRLR